MKRERVARYLTGLACLGFLGTAALHSTGYGSVVRQAKDVPGIMGDVMPALWLAFSLDLTVIGAIVGVVALRPRDVARPILVIAALCPLSAAGLQLRFIGFVPPTGILLFLGILTCLGAAAWPGRSVLGTGPVSTGSGRS